MGIIGCTGGLGKAIASRAVGFGMDVYGVARMAREVSPLPGVHSPIWFVKTLGFRFWMHLDVIFVLLGGLERSYLFF